MNFRALRADEIECRLNTVSEKGVSLLLYKDARCDMNILDETVGPENWQRSHSRDNANCTVSIWDKEKGMWISKEDTGKESYAEKEKGIASDSFKRACVNWGIGRELYTAPFIWVNAGDVHIKEKNGKYTTYDRFSISNIQINNKKIEAIQINNESTGKVVFSYGYGKVQPVDKDKGTQVEQKKERTITSAQYDKLYDYCADNGIDIDKLARSYKASDAHQLTAKQYADAMDAKYLKYFKQKCGAA